MAQNFWYPPGSAQAGSISVTQGTSPWITQDSAADASLASIDSKTPTVGQKTMANSSPVVIASDQTAVPISAASLPLPTGASTLAAQTTGNASLASIDGHIPQLTLVGSALKVDGSAVTQPISAASLPLPTGASTAANQATANASLSSIDSKLTSPITVTGALTDTQLRATPVPVSGTVTANAGTNLNTSALNLQATQLVFSNKSASAFINSPFDETVITYVGATTDIATVVYKLATVVVNTLTMTYDGSNRLIDVVKT